MMRRLLAGIVTVFAALASTAGAVAGSPASPQASCIGILVSFEAHIEPGFVGGEVREVARQSRGAVGEFVRTVAHEHAGSVEACIPEE